MSNLNESPEHRLKRLRMRSMRRGIKEMDLILTGFADARLGGLTPGEVDIYDALLWENDHDLYQWVTGQVSPPDRFAEMIDQISKQTNAPQG